MKAFYDFSSRGWWVNPPSVSLFLLFRLRARSPRFFISSSSRHVWHTKRQTQKITNGRKVEQKHSIQNGNIGHIDACPVPHVPLIELHILNQTSHNQSHTKPSEGFTPSQARRSQAVAAGSHPRDDIYDTPTPSHHQNSLAATRSGTG